MGCSWPELNREALRWQSWDLSLPKPIGAQFISLQPLGDGHRATEVGVYHAGFGLFFEVTITFYDPIRNFWNKNVCSVPLYIGRI